MKKYVIKSEIVKIKIRIIIIRALIITITTEIIKRVLNAINVTVLDITRENVALMYLEVQDLGIQQIMALK
jgi:ABC-type antimicrobial peptide transport system permease subunit